MRYSAFVAIHGLVPALLALPVASTALAGDPAILLAQAGSTGGSIGKQGKSVSGGEAEPAPPRAKPAPSKPAPQRSAAPARSDTAAKPGNGPAGCARVVGSWTWKFGSLDTVGVVFRSDGTGAATNGLTSTYTCNEGMLTVAWSHGFTDRLTLSSDGRQLNGNGAFGIGITASRR